MLRSRRFTGVGLNLGKESTSPQVSDELLSISQVHTLQHPRHVTFHCADLQTQPGCDFLIRHALAEQAADPLLVWRQGV
jgi:hypothetical protein